MTAQEFRANPELRARFKELISDPVVEQAIIILKDGKVPVDPKPDADAIVSVRMLSQMVGADAAISTFLSLGDPLPVPYQELQPTFEPEDLPEIT